MRATTVTRAARVYTSARSGTTSAGPSSVAVPSHAARTFLPEGSADPSTLRSLVGLHHSASGFMADPSEIPGAFETAFRDHLTEFRSYEQFRAGALRVAEQRAVGGLESFSERGAGGQGLGARRALGDDAAPGEQALLSRDVFRAPRKWTRRHHPPAAELTERELRVKEALFGTWERAMDARPRPSLEGVVDITAARGLTVAQAAKEWNARDEVDVDSTEDGM